MERSIVFNGNESLGKLQDGTIQAYTAWRFATAAVVRIDEENTGVSGSADRRGGAPRSVDETASVRSNPSARR